MSIWLYLSSSNTHCKWGRDMYHQQGLTKQENLVAHLKTNQLIVAAPKLSQQSNASSFSGSGGLITQPIYKCDWRRQYNLLTFWLRKDLNSWNWNISAKQTGDELNSSCTRELPVIYIKKDSHRKQGLRRLHFLLVQTFWGGGGGFHLSRKLLATAEFWHRTSSFKKDYMEYRAFH